MTAGNCKVSRCGLCRFYSHEGRRDGTCNQLNVNVSAQWKACSLARSPFSNLSENSVGITKVDQKIDLWVAEIAEVSVEKPILPLLSKAGAPILSTIVSKTVKNNCEKEEINFQ